jgi:hypothetical protein
MKLSAKNPHLRVAAKRYKRIDIENPCSFTETYEKAYYIEKEKLEEWKQI